MKKFDFQISARLSKETTGELLEAARERNCRLVDIVRMAIEEWLEKYSKLKQGK